MFFALLALSPISSAFAGDDCARWVVTHPNDYTTMIQCAPVPELVWPHQPISSTPHTPARPAKRAAMPHYQIQRAHHHHARHQGVEVTGRHSQRIFPSASQQEWGGRLSLSGRRVPMLHRRCTTGRPDGSIICHRLRARAISVCGGLIWPPARSKAPRATMAVGDKAGFRRDLASHRSDVQKPKTRKNDMGSANAPLGDVS